MRELLSQIRAGKTGSASFCFWLFAAALIMLLPLKKRPRWGLRAALCGVGFVALGWRLPSQLLNDSLLLVCLWFGGAWLLMCVMCRVICDISWTEAFFCGINAVLAEHIGSSLQILLTSLVTGGDVSRLNDFGMAAYLPVYVLFWFAMGRGMPRQTGHLKVGKLSVATTCVTGLTVTVALSMLLKSNIDPELLMSLKDSHAIALLETGQLYAIFFCGSILALEYAQQREMIANEKLAASHEMWSVRQKQYQMSRETIDTINRRCHDMKHQIAALMDAEGDSEARRRYGEEVQRLIEIYDLQVNTRNEALNTILMEKGLYCRTHGISWSCAVDDTALGFIERMDLYVLLGNALDNAIEAVERIPEESRRIIQLQISRKGRFACIRLENSYEGQLEWQGTLPVTTKADKSSHGIGLKSIRSIAARYGGYASASAEGPAFILSVLLPIPEAGEASDKTQ